MTLKTLKTKQNISLTLDKDFIQYCELNEIEDIEKLARETFKRGFDLLKYGRLPESELTPQDKKKVVKIKDNPPVPSPKKDDEPKVVKPDIYEATPLKSSNAKEVFTEMGVITKKKDDKNNLYDE